MFQQCSASLFLAAQEGRFSRSVLLKPFSGLWALGAALKNHFYDCEMLSVEQLSVPVVSVGGIVAGGSGKTPLVHLLAKTLESAGSIAILSRGYLAHRSGLSLGDEATLLTRRLPRVSCLIGKDRIASGKKAIQAGAKLLLLDDGFQYRRLHRDLEIVIIDASNPFGYGAFLPRGLLRDPPHRLEEADVLFVNGDAPIEGPPGVPLVRVRPKINRILKQMGQKRGCIKNLVDCKVGVFCAIAHPTRFLSTLQKEGAIEVARWFLPDHERASPEALQAFSERCRKRGAELIVCTEKDAVKIPPTFSLSLPIAYLEMELEIVSGEEHWNKLIEKISLKMNH